MSETIHTIEQWGLFEVALQGPESGNPFQDVEFGACFQFQNRKIEVGGFYDGDGTYRVRFMPDVVGPWRYETLSNVDELAGQEGEFSCVEPTAGNRGPVHVHDTYHFAYADGTPHYSVGTTCYVWNHQVEELEEQTLQTLRSAPFNKLRMCVFPKDYTYNKNEPRWYPFPKKGDNWDFTRFIPEYFQHLEKRVADLMELGIEADIILLHPYDRWGFANMDAETDDFYLRYVVRRLAAYRNVWWSMANEYDFMKEKQMSDWDRFFRIVQENDPYQRLRSIHNGHVVYDQNKPWVTHVSMQDHDLGKTSEWLKQYHKPVIVDECGYEGNIPEGWGNLSARELVHRFWLGTTRGGYVGHGETYRHLDDTLWWSKGGVLHGESPARIAFLRGIIEEGPACGFMPSKVQLGSATVEKAGICYLTYFGVSQPIWMPVTLPEGHKFRGEVIDTWEMTITPLQSTLEGKCDIALPGTPYMALRLWVVE
jgi:hypothetical protein